MGSGLLVFNTRLIEFCLTEKFYHNSDNPCPIQVYRMHVHLRPVWSQANAIDRVLGGK